MSSTADGAARLAGLNVSDNARAAIARAVKEVEPYGNEDPRVAALVSELLTIANPVDGGDDHLAKAMVVVKKVEDALSSDPSAMRSHHELVKSASRRIQSAYLAQHSAAHVASVRGERVPVTKAQTSLEDRAAEIRKADSSVSGYDAMVKALKENQALQRAYVDSVR